MDAVDAGKIALLQVRGNGFIGGQHELFDQAMGPVALASRDALHHAQFIKLNHRFRHVKVNGAALYPLAIQNLGQLVHQLKILHQWAIAMAQVLIAFDNCVYIGVGHAFCRADDALSQLVAGDLSSRINLHHARHHQPVYMRAQAADVG